MDEKEPGLVGRIKDKLVESKQKWAREGRLLAETIRNTSP